MESSNKALLIALSIMAIASVGKSQILAPVSQAIIIASNLTCSNPSPSPSIPLLFPSRSPLSGASVTAYCLGDSDVTTTDSFGSFALTLNFPTPKDLGSISIGCTPIITVPANCTITTLSLVRPTFLRSSPLIIPVSINNSVPGGSATFIAPFFYAIS